MNLAGSTTATRDLRGSQCFGGACTFEGCGKVRVLITGGAGYIGSLLTGVLLNRGYHVTVVDDLLFGGESLLGYLHHPSFRFIKGTERELWIPLEPTMRDLLDRQRCRLEPHAAFDQEVVIA